MAYRILKDYLKSSNYTLWEITKEDKHLILSVLYDLEPKAIGAYTKKEIRDINKKYKNKNVDAYFKNNFYGIMYSSFTDNVVSGYCFVKHPMTSKPETMTVVHKDYKNKGIARILRDEIVTHRDKFFGNIIYSAVENTNLASLKSVLNSGYQVFDVTKDGYIQLLKVLPYVRGN